MIMLNQNRIEQLMNLGRIIKWDWGFFVASAVRREPEVLNYLQHYELSSKV